MRAGLQGVNGAVRGALTTHPHPLPSPKRSSGFAQAGGHRTRSNFTVIRTMSDGAMSVFACGRYLDHVVEQAGVLKYRERTVILDSKRIDTLLIIPI